MPILDPILQFYLLEEKTNEESNDSISFYLRYLRIASRNLSRNLTTINTSSMLFKNDFINSIDFINAKFGCKINNKSLKYSTKSNYYKLLYDQLNNKLFINLNLKSVKGKYFKQCDQYSTNLFFRPNLYFSEYHSWYLSDNPIAILCIHFDKFPKNKIDDDIIKLICIEADLLAAAGFTLVLCLNYSQDYSKFLVDLIKRDQFSEIHCNFKENSSTEHFLKYVNPMDNSNFQFFRGFFFIYTPFFKKNSGYRLILRKLQDKPRFYIFKHSTNFKSVIKPFKLEPEKKFNYCKTGFKSDLIKIKISNIPLFNKEKDDEDFIISGTSYCYILPTSFLDWTNERKEIFFFDEEGRCTLKYVYFNELHSIKNDLYVNDPLLLGNINEKNLHFINKVERKIKKTFSDRKSDKFDDHKKFRISNETKKIEIIRYVANAYAFVESSKKDFFVYRTQLYTVYDAVERLLNKYNFSQKFLIKQKKFLESKLFSLINKKSNNLLHPDLQNITVNPKLRDELTTVLNGTFSNPKNFVSTIFNLNINKKEEIEKKLKEIESELENYNSKSKGVIYQVETGEGKSCIVSLIAAVLALKGKTVHITSSNIKLSNRDYMQSFDFFDLIELRSAVFLHENELPHLEENENENKKEKEKEEVDLFASNPFGLNKSNKDKYDKYYENSEYNYYDKKQFDNSSRMNFAVCGLDNDNTIPEKKPQIIFSTFVNFECFYLKMLEICPGYVDDYFDNCVLLIDEADSVLIDEIANGTIVSKSMKSNMKEILLHVYDNKKKGVEADQTFEEIKDKCADLTLNDVKQMYLEIDIVCNDDEFKEKGKRYTIESFKVKNPKKKENLIKKTFNYIEEGIEIVKETEEEFFKMLKNEEEEDEDDDDDDEDDDEEEDEEEEDDSNDEPETKFHHIVPFDYDHKGILEPNKEFSGFIQQFIAIKEMRENNVKNMIIKDMSMSYLYVSHPIFVKLYSKVCGFTGTIGGIKDKEIYKKQYDLITKRIPRNSANKRVELPMILCKDQDERNDKIVSEIIEFHKKGNPVLVIFQGLKEIDQVKKLLENKNYNKINIFDGKNNDVKPENIAGIQKAISLGTNVCGRGTNIIVNDENKPLHVIISYYTSNSRVINQAHGRTARKGQEGTSRIICVKEQFLYPQIFSDEGIQKSIEEFRIKNQLQSEYIELFKLTRPWIFSISKEIIKQTFNDKQILEMRNARINVNRIVAYNYEFPIKMTRETFLKIQLQKIVSLVNCPNTKYLWKLFQQYVREMILESWSLMINDVDKKFFEQKENQKYKESIDELNKAHSIDLIQIKEKLNKINTEFSGLFKRYEELLKKNVDELLTSLFEYLPVTSPKKDENTKHIVSTFMHIFNKVIGQYQDSILDTFDQKRNAYSSFNMRNGFIGFQIGFRPYSLLSESGARILHKNYRKLNYIKDPELIFLKRNPRNRLCLLSITEKLDDIFNEIFKKINEFIGKQTFLKLFVRRALCGCEFGICFNLSCDSTNEMNNDLLLNQNCLFDKDPLFLFAINLRSMSPILVGILVIALVYLANFIKEIIEFIFGLPEKVPRELLKKGLIAFAKVVFSKSTEKFFDKIIDILQNTLNKQIDKLKSLGKEKIVNIINGIKSLFKSSIGKEVIKGTSSFIFGKINFKLNALSMIKDSLDSSQLMEISLLILLCVASFIITYFGNRHNALKNANDDSIEYNSQLEKNEKKKTTIEKLEQNRYQTVNEENPFEFTDKNIHEVVNIDNYVNDENRYYIKYKLFKTTEKLLKFSNFVVEKKGLFKDVFNFVSDVKTCIQTKGENTGNLLRFEYPEMNKVIMKQVGILATNKVPSILNFIGYSKHKKKKYMYFENKGTETLINIINKKIKLNYTNKVIIAYGIAKALESLHKNHVIHRNLNASNIIIDNNFYPYLSDFCFAIQTDEKLLYNLSKMKPGFMAPEFIEDYKANQKSFKLDVYAYGMVLYIIFAETDPFNHCSNEEVIENTKNGIRPNLTNNVPVEWKKLISDCLSSDPNKRPDFPEICEVFEGNVDDKALDINAFKKYKEKFTNVLNK